MDPVTEAEESMYSPWKSSQQTQSKHYLEKLHVSWYPDSWEWNTGFRW